VFPRLLAHCARARGVLPRLLPLALPPEDKRGDRS
jgi:hypothetical protein